MRANHRRPSRYIKQAERPHRHCGRLNSAGAPMELKVFGSVLSAPTEVVCSSVCIYV